MVGGRIDSVCSNGICTELDEVWDITGTGSRVSERINIVGLYGQQTVDQDWGILTVVEVPLVPMPD